MRRRRSSLIGTCLGTILALAGAPSSAQNFSGLEGRELSPTTTLEATARSLLTDLLAGDGATSGEIRRVVVTGDFALRLTLQVEVAALDGHALWAEVFDADDARQPVAGERLDIPAGAETVDLELLADEGLAEGQEIESAYLRIHVAPPGGSRAVLSRDYRLPKRWRREIAPENLVLRAVAEPVGAATTLRREAPGSGELPQIQLNPVAIERLRHPEVIEPARPRVSDPARPRVSDPGAAVRLPTTPMMLALMTTTRLSAHLITHDGRYVQAREGGGGDVLASSTNPGPWETLTLVDQNGGKLEHGDSVRLQTSSGNHWLRAGGAPRRSISATATDAGGATTFRIERVSGSGTISYGDEILLSENGPYIGVAGTGLAVGASRSAAVARFRMVEPGARPVAVLSAAHMNARLITVANFDFGVNEEDRERGAQGPGADRLPLLDGLRVDVEGLKADDILEVHRDLYVDRNASTGILYFLPRAYHLGWDRDRGYGMRMLYSAAGEAGEAGDVMMALQLDAGLDESELGLVRTLAQAYSRRNTRTVFRQLRPLPIEAAPVVSLAGGLGSIYEIPPERITVNAISDVLGALEMSLVTDTVTKESLQLALVEDVGINGTLALAPAGDLPTPVIPVSAQLADPRTFGRFGWRRGERWTNPTPYPMRLRYLHALMLRDDTPVVYSWRLGDVDVPPRASVEIDATTVPTWVDGEALRLWLQYVPDRECSECDQRVIDAITGGVTAVAASRITFRTLTPLEDVGAFEVDVQVRSRHLHPSDRDLRELTVLVLDADRQEFTTGPIYVVESADGAASDGPLFEYRMTVVMPDGTTHEGEWVPSERLRVIIGSRQVIDALGFDPSQGGDSSPLPSPETWNAAPRVPE